MAGKERLTKREYTEIATENGLPSKKAFYRIWGAWNPDTWARDFTVTTETETTHSALTGEDIWQHWEKKTRHIGNKPEFHAEIEIPDNGPFGISFIADTHFSSDGTNHAIARKHAETIRDTPRLYAMLGGDFTENYLNNPVTVLGQEPVGQQWAGFIYWLEIIKHDTLAAICGNHDARTTKAAGVDQVRQICEGMKVLYHPDEIYLKLKCGRREYKILFPHKTRFSSSYNPTHAAKQVIRMGMRDADVVITAHRHEPAIETSRLTGKWRTFVSCGCYKIEDRYCSQQGFNQSYAAAPTLIFKPDGEVWGHVDIVEAAQYLRFLNGAEKN